MSPRTSVAEYNKRLRLYSQGFSDGQIGLQTNRSTGCIAKWRYVHHFKPNRLQGNPVTGERAALRRKLYDEGLSDKAIGRQLGMSRSCILAWRRKEKLPPHLHVNDLRLTPEQEQTRRDMYASKLSDGQIAQRLHLSGSAVIAQWRKRRNLVAHHPRKGRWPEKIKRKIVGLYLRGMSYVAISRYLKLPAEKVQITIGYFLQHQCREAPSCPMKALLPETELKE